MKQTGCRRVLAILLGFKFSFFLVLAWTSGFLMPEVGLADVSGLDSESPSSGSKKSYPEESSDSASIQALNALQNFLANTNKFTGKKISIETQSMELRDFFAFLSDEVGINLLISDDVKGSLSLKLKAVPWDQALVMVMRAKHLGYTRVGDVIRIASIEEIKKEEEDLIRIVSDRKALEPLQVKLIPVNYAKVEDLEKQVKPFLSKNGSVIADVRTSALVISDDSDTVGRVMKLVKSIDIPPQQVLIEGKVVEASTTFERNLGIQWGMGGQAITLFDQKKPWKSSYGPVRFTPSFSTSTLTSGGSANLNFGLGTLDVLGQISSILSLYEKEGLVKVISSPRIVTVQNEKAEISQTTQIPVPTTTASGGVPMNSVTFKDTKLKLEVIPQITNDNSILMGIVVNREFPGASSDNVTKTPPIYSRSATTKILVKNSQTAVIGGIYQSEATDSENRVPGLGSIPLIGWLFKGTANQNNKTELLIFLTPRILGPGSFTAGSTPGDSAPSVARERAGGEGWIP